MNVGIFILAQFKFWMGFNRLARKPWAGLPPQEIFWFILLDLSDSKTGYVYL